MIQNINDIIKTTFNIMIKILGLLLLLAGLWIALQVLSNAQELYDHPERIERFAVAVAKGSNIDKMLAPDTDSHDATASKNSDDIRISYFFSWIIVFLLLLLIARISIMAIKTGSELLFFNPKITEPASDNIVK